MYRICQQPYGFDLLNGNQINWGALYKNEAKQGTGQQHVSYIYTNRIGLMHSLLLLTREGN